MFRFYVEDFWLNLHLYVLGRAEAKSPDRGRRAVAGAPAEQDRGLLGLTPEEQGSWHEAVSFYASGPSKQDAVFDQPLVAAVKALAGAGASPSLEGAGLEPALRAALERAASAYRKGWWREHAGANGEWVAAMRPLLDRHGAEVLAFITRAYGLPWPPEGYPVRVLAYTNWAGAFSLTGANLLVISSRDEGNQGLVALETTFHEAMHQWDDSVEEMLREAARKGGQAVPDDLAHAMIFFTAGEAVHHAAPGHVPYAEAGGIWTGLPTPSWPARSWPPTRTSRWATTTCP